MVLLLDKLELRECLAKENNMANSVRLKSECSFKKLHR